MQMTRRSFLKFLGSLPAAYAVAQLPTVATAAPVVVTDTPVPITPSIGRGPIKLEFLQENATALVLYMDSLNMEVNTLDQSYLSGSTLAFARVVKSCEFMGVVNVETPQQVSQLFTTKPGTCRISYEESTVAILQGAYLCDVQLQLQADSQCAHLKIGYQGKKQI